MICRKRLPKGEILSTECRAYSNHHLIEASENKHELIDLMRANGYKRNEYTIIWVAFNETTDGAILDIDGVGDTKKEAIEDFWDNYYRTNGALAQHG